MTTMVRRTVCEQVPCTVTKKVKEKVYETVPVTCNRTVKETVIEKVPVTVTRNVKVTEMRRGPRDPQPDGPRLLGGRQRLRQHRGGRRPGSGPGGCCGQILGPNAASGLPQGAATYGEAAPNRVFVEGATCSRSVPVTTTRMVQETQVRQVPYTVTKTVPETVTKMVPTNVNPHGADPGDQDGAGHDLPDRVRDADQAGADQGHDHEAGDGDPDGEGDRVPAGALHQHGQGAVHGHRERAGVRDPEGAGADPDWPGLPRPGERARPRAARRRAAATSAPPAWPASSRTSAGRRRSGTSWPGCARGGWPATRAPWSPATRAPRPPRPRPAASSNDPSENVSSARGRPAPKGVAPPAGVIRRGPTDRLTPRGRSSSPGFSVRRSGDQGCHTPHLIALPHAVSGKT